MIRIFLGGSFDPVHLAHIQMAQMVADTLKAHTDVPIHTALLPTAGNPFKDNPTLSQHRLAMLKLAIMQTDFSICELEIHQPPPSYTIDTVRTLTHQHPDDTLIFIIGGDSLASLVKWRNADELLHSVKFWVFARADAPDDAMLPTAISSRLTADLDAFLASDLAHTDSIYLDKRPIHAISSTQIRDALKNNQPVDALLLKAVHDYIKAQGLYR